MENDTTISKEGLFEPVLPGSVTFESSILAPLRNNYLYEESKEFFLYSSAQLINNAALLKRYSAFRAEKLKQGYSEEELEESFGFLLLADKSRANRLADTGLIVGQGTCTTLGDCSKGVYISKYSDCLDLKRWYDGKTGYLVLLKLTKGRVKEVAENYTQNFTPPTAGFDCHVSEQLREVCATTSFFLAFERTQYYMYELLDGVEKIESCPRHVCPFAIVAFSYGKTGIPLEVKDKSQEKSSFHYQPWCGQLEIRSVLYNIGLKSIHGAMFPAKLSKTIKVDHAVGVSELRKTLPQAVFETSLVGEVSLDGIWFSMYDVISFEARNDLAFLTQELKEKDLALVICLEDSGFLVLLHPSNFLSYEGAGTDKAFALQGMFIYPESRSVPRETKSEYDITKVSSEVLQVLPALNYAELEMEKCPPKQSEEPLAVLKKHLQNFAALIFPGLTSSPSREVSMFPDQYDVPNGFPLVAPKWTEQTGNRLRTYLKSPCNFQIPVSRAQELLAAGRQQRSDDHEEDVYYYISSPEAPQTPAYMVSERDLPNEAEHLACRNDSEDQKKASEQQADIEKTVAAKPCALVREVNTPGAASVATPENNPAEKTDTSPTSSDLPTENSTRNIHAVTSQDSEKASECFSADDKCSGDEFSRAVSTDIIQTTSVALSSSDIGDDTSTPASNAEMEVDHSDKGDCVSDVLTIVGGQITVAEKLQEADLPTTSVNRTEALITGCNDVQPKAIANVSAKTRYVPTRRRKRRRKALKRGANAGSKITTRFYNTTLSSCPSTESTPEQSSSIDTIQSSPHTLKKDWRSLPRRKRICNADLGIKRTLRSDFKNTEMPRLKSDANKKNTTAITEPAFAKSITSTPKRKMDGINMRERYGLKTIVTDCGFVFVPHGSEVAPGDLKSHENQQVPESSSVTTSSPTLPTHDKAQPAEMENTVQVVSINTAKVLLSGDFTEKSSDLESTEKNKGPATDHVYKAISISKLKTVLKRARKTIPSGGHDYGKSISDNAEPKLKRGKPNDVNLSDCSKQGNTESQEPVKNTPSQPGLRTTFSQEKQSSKSPKENGGNNLENLFPKQTDQQLTSKPVQNRAEVKRLSSDGQRDKEEVTVGVPAPSDGLNLLADLALSVNSEETKPNLEVKHLGTKITSSPHSVIQLLKNLNPRLNFPAKSPFPHGLVVTGDMILEISKEHSYSQSTSPLAGTCPQVQPLGGSVATRLSMKSNLLLKLPDFTNHLECHNEGGKNGWKFLPSFIAAQAAVMAKVQRSLFLSCRSIVEKGGSIQITRHWKESYDFKFDSKFTNDRLDKCVTRALHGKWDFSIEDTYEQVHLIFHMWIGLFYSKSTSRFFHFDQICPSGERKRPEKSIQCSVQTSPPPSDVEFTSKEDKPSSLDPISDALDLSVKIPGTEDYSTTENNSTPSSGTRAEVESMSKDKLPANRPSLSFPPSVLAECISMDYRSAVDALDENSTSDCTDCSGKEDDISNFNESSCTDVLESNSAYGQLCGLASNMKIDEQKLLNVQRNELVCKDQPTSMTTNKNNAETTESESKDVSVFHQVVGCVGPVLSKVHNLLPRKKLLLRSLSLIGKHKEEVHGTVPIKPASNDEKCEAQVNEEDLESTSVCLESCSVDSAIVSDKNEARIDDSNDENSAEKISVSAERNDGEICSFPIGDTPVNELDESNQAKQEAMSVIDGAPTDVNDLNVEMHVNNKATEEVGSVPDVRDELPIDRPDVNHETDEVKPLSRVLSENSEEISVNDENIDEGTSAPDETSNIVPDVIKSDELVEPERDHTSDARNDTPEDIDVASFHGECDEYDDNASDEVNSPVNIRDISVDVQAKDKLCVIDDIPVLEQNIDDTNQEATHELAIRTNILADVQDVNNLNKEPKPWLDVRDDTPVNVQDVNESTTDENATKYHPGVRDFSYVDRQHDVDMTEETYATEEHGCGKDGSNEDVIDESERKLEKATICDAETEVYSDANNTVDELQDSTGCEDMNISYQESEDGNRKTVCEVNEDNGKMQGVEIKTDPHGPSSYEKHSDGAQPRISEYSYAGHASSTSHELNMLEESHSSSAVDGACVPTQNESESVILQDEFVDQHEIAEVKQYKPTNTSDDVISLTEIVNPEPYELRDLSVQGTSGETGEGKTMEKSTDQIPLVSIISEWPPAKRVDTHEHFESTNLSSLALQIVSEAEVNSRCCTPTLDEPDYNQWTDKVSNIQEEMLQDITESGHCCVNKSPTKAWLALDSSEDSHSEIEKFPANKDQILQNSRWSRNEYNATIKETDESQTSMTDDYVPEENADYSDTIPPHRNTEEIELQQDQSGGFSEQYEEGFYEELPPTWTHDARFKTVEQNEWYTPDEDTHYTNSTFHQEFAYSPRETTENSTINPDWIQRGHYSKSSSYVNESSERVLSLRHQADFAKSNEGSVSHKAEPVRYSRMKRKRKDFIADVDLSIKRTVSCGSDWSSSSRTLTSSTYQRKGERKRSFDWHRYFRRERIFDSKEDGDGPFRDPPSSIVTMFDRKGNRVIFESPSIQNRSSGIHGMGHSVEDKQLNTVTQSLMELEYLIFSEKMTHLLKNCKTTSRTKPQHRLNISPVENSLTVQFSRLDEQNSFSALDQTWPALSMLKINVDMSERKPFKKTSNYSKPMLQSLFCERGTKATCSKLSDISKECSKSYQTIMNDICVGKPGPQQSDEPKSKWDFKCVTTSKQSGLCGRIKRDMFHHLHDNLNSIVRQACKTKYKFYILVTSADPFFEETKDLLEAEGHTAVEANQFDFDATGQVPLLIILRNEDIANHIFEVPHLLELKKSSKVLFVGIDQPDDVVNLTHQELFAKGGFVVFDETALDTLSLENMKKFVAILEELDKKGKWKWFLHYRDSRKLRENARCSPEAQRRKQFIDCCQEAGIVEVLPYHECDVISRDRPDYLRCLVHLQIQNISARFPVFITDTPDDTFERNGVLTMNIYTFSRILSNDTCSVS